MFILQDLGGPCVRPRTSDRPRVAMLSSEQPAKPTLLFHHLLLGNGSQALELAPDAVIAGGDAFGGKIRLDLGDNGRIAGMSAELGVDDFFGICFGGRAGHAHLRCRPEAPRLVPAPGYL